MIVNIRNKLDTNENRYLTEKMTMIYVSIKLNDETYKHIFVRLNIKSSCKYQIIDEMFENFKRVYVDLNKMQTAMNAFIKLTQVSKFVEFDIF